MNKNAYEMKLTEEMMNSSEQHRKKNTDLKAVPQNCYVFDV